jgi:hypothetical protein
MKKWLVCLLLLALILSGCEMEAIPKDAVFGFAREIPEAEQAVRLQVVKTAEEWLGCKEVDESFKPIIDLYNDHKPLAMDYAVKYTDQWCATFGSTVAIQCGFTDIIPTECGCQRQIGLFEKLDCWQEDDAYIPLPGDYIYYALSNKDEANTAWSDHVGIVVGTWNDYIKVIEGNNLESVRYRIIKVDNVVIRGYGVPDYASVTDSKSE